MKNYLNNDEKNKHLILIMAMTTAQDLLNCSGPTEEEKELLQTAANAISEFNKSVFDRIGDSYKRSIINRSRDNEIDIKTKKIYTPNRTEEDYTEYIDHEELVDIINSCSEFECVGCKREDCKNCALYRININIGTKGQAEDNNLCPFRRDELTVNNCDDLEWGEDL